MLPKKLHRFLLNLDLDKTKVAVLTGAGVSAESGIPTFRGEEGYWTEGSTVYTPQEMATYQMFTRDPRLVWRWYLYRFSVVSDAEPNEGHYALVQMENHLKDNFQLITQNVDHLHIRAGSRRVYSIHGDISYMRCANECTTELFHLPESWSTLPKCDESFNSYFEKLKCPKCSSLTRPHVLWFDEYYNDTYFYFNQSLEAALESDVLIVVGTSGATNLPNQIVRKAYSRGHTIIDINIERNPFSTYADNSNNGAFLEGKSGYWLSEIAKTISRNI